MNRYFGGPHVMTENNVLRNLWKRNILIELVGLRNIILFVLNQYSTHSNKGRNCQD